MNTRSSFAILATLAIFSLASATSVDGALLSVDFSRTDGNPTGTQPGFINMAGGVGQSPATAGPGGAYGVYTVTVAGQGFFNTGANASNIDPSVIDLYRDYYYNNSTTPGVGVQLSIQGVTPNTDYDLTLWSYDADNGSSTPTTWTPNVNTTGTSGLITNLQTPYPDSLDDNSATIRIRSTTSTLSIFGTTTSGTGGTRLNGIELNEVPAPEPSSAVLAGLGATLVGCLRRRKSVDAHGRRYRDDS